MDVSQGMMGSWWGWHIYMCLHFGYSFCFPLFPLVPHPPCLYPMLLFISVYSHRPKFPKNPSLVPSFPEFEDMYWKEFKRRQEMKRQKQNQQVKICTGSSCITPAVALRMCAVLKPWGLPNVGEKGMCKQFSTLVQAGRIKCIACT